MEKDLESYFRHEHTYQGAAPQWIQERLGRMDHLDYFHSHGFYAAMEKNPQVRSLHIDLGCGAGWLLKHTAPFFKNVIGIEPSSKAIEYAKEYTKEYQNIEFINGDMLESLMDLNPQEPYFVTTAAVFVHIKEFHVKNTLAFLNKAPKGSVICFSEPYDKNIKVPFWTIYHKSWWRRELSHWNLEFLETNETHDGKKLGYKTGIYGVCLGKENPDLEVEIKNDWTLINKQLWILTGFYYKMRYAFVGMIKKTLGIKDKLY
jgi:2-polyprenyl-3-methyl-5-hydroxy-6-metoxy-1,4-benzoquinol methylase